MAHFRDLKRRIRAGLSGPDWRREISELDEVPARRLPGPLFSLLLDPEPLVRWRAVEAFGRAVARMADAPPGDKMGGGIEQARVILRQCLWRLNEESGGLGWGAPEALGESLARHARLAGEFHRVLASYVREETTGEGNYLEHVPLRRGVFWALGRLAEARPELLRSEVPALLAGLAEEDPANRGLCARALGLVCAGGDFPLVRQALERLAEDPAEFELYSDGELALPTVGQAARAALENLARA